MAGWMGIRFAGRVSGKPRTNGKNWREKNGWRTAVYTLGIDNRSEKRDHSWAQGPWQGKSALRNLHRAAGKPCASPEPPAGAAGTGGAQGRTERPKERNERRATADPLSGRGN